MPRAFRITCKTMIVPSGDALLLFILVLAAAVGLWALSSLGNIVSFLSMKGAFMLRPMLHKFEDMITTYEKQLLQLDEPEVQRRPTEGGWSKKEILGHLIDCASNSHQQFVRLQLSSEMKVPGYERNDWVRLQNYQAESWSALVHLWGQYNWHILHVISCIPAHRLKQLCFIGSGEPVTLEFLIRNYVLDVQHHLGLILKHEDSKVAWV